MFATARLIRVTALPAARRGPRGGGRGPRPVAGVRLRVYLLLSARNSVQLPTATQLTSHTLSHKKSTRVSPTRTLRSTESVGCMTLPTPPAGRTRNPTPPKNLKRAQHSSGRSRLNQARPCRAAGRPAAATIPPGGRAGRPTASFGCVRVTGQGLGFRVRG